MHLVYPAVLAALLFCTGLYGVLARRNTILVLMSVELMLAAVSLNLVAFDVWLRDTLHSGQVFTLFLIALSAAEIGIGLALVLLLYRNSGVSAVDRMRVLDGDSDPTAPAEPSAAPAASAPAASAPTASAPTASAVPTDPEPARRENTTT
jgi:NADH-quinone oxidoreductase subunit K